MQLTQLLLSTQRISGTRKAITIINPHFYDEFFTWLRESSIQLQIKAFIAVALSGGLRVTEALMLRHKDINIETGFFLLRVLKKRNKVTRRRIIDGKTETYNLKANRVYREAKLHPVAVDILREYFHNFRISGFSRCFPYTRNTALLHMKQIFGRQSCVHALRHSHISWLVNVKKLPISMVADLLKMDVKVVSAYSHVDAKHELTKLYEAA